jgi:hypothetical protein
MLRAVSSELVRVTAAPARFSSGQRVEHLIAKAVADVEQDRVLARQLVRMDRLALRPLVRERHDDLERLFVQELGDAPASANGSAMMAASIAAGAQRRLQVLGQVLLDVERHLRRDLVQRRDQVGQQVRRDGVDDAERQRPASGLRSACAISRIAPSPRAPSAPARRCARRPA